MIQVSSSGLEITADEPPQRLCCGAFASLSTQQHSLCSLRVLRLLTRSGHWSQLVRLVSSQNCAPFCSGDGQCQLSGTYPITTPMAIWLLQSAVGSSPLAKR